MILTEEIFQETYIVRRLKIKESVKSFDCGDTDLNDFILNESLLYRKELLAVSYAVEDNSKSVVAYFSLANDRVSLSDFEDKTAYSHNFIRVSRITIHLYSLILQCFTKSHDYHNFYHK